MKRRLFCKLTTVPVLLPIIPIGLASPEVIPEYEPNMVNFTVTGIKDQSFVIIFDSISGEELYSESKITKDIDIKVPLNSQLTTRVRCVNYNVAYLSMEVDTYNNGDMSLPINQLRDC